jgi:hypothetical protein
MTGRSALKTRVKRAYVPAIRVFAPIITRQME